MNLISNDGKQNLYLAPLSDEEFIMCNGEGVVIFHLLDHLNKYIIRDIFARMNPSLLMNYTIDRINSTNKLKKEPPKRLKIDPTVPPSCKLTMVNATPYVFFSQIRYFNKLI